MQKRSPLGKAVEVKLDYAAWLELGRQERLDDHAAAISSQRDRCRREARGADAHAGDGAALIRSADAIRLAHARPVR